MAFMASANNPSTLAATQSRGEPDRAAIEFLFGRLNYERTPTVPYQERHFKLARMFELAARIGNPQERLQIVHIAGSKGKGSTATMIAAMLQASGRSVGMYTSPHIAAPEERISLNLTACSTAEFDGLIDTIRPHVLDMDAAIADDPTQRGPTYFEILTAAGLLHFENRAVDVAVLEVGLGGRLDSTNICQPVCSVITTISKDHTRQLGETLPEIAAEKAGIIKRGVPVVCGVASHEAQAVIYDYAEKCGAALYQRGRDFDLEVEPGSDGFTYREYVASDRRQVSFELARLRTGMLGAHQRSNAATAIRAARVLESVGLTLSDESIRTGIRQAQAPARVEVVRRDPLVIVDAAHNEASTAALVSALHEHWPDHDKTFVMAATRGKDITGILNQLLPVAQRLILTRYLNNPRCCCPQTVAAEAATIQTKLGLDVRIEVEPLPQAALTSAKQIESSRPQLICVTGSFFLASELRSIAAK
jgi:dihydrofolate synthase/folylpolyglutamate synthase